MLKPKKITLALAALNLAAYGACFYLFVEIKNIDKVVSDRFIQIESEVKRNESVRSVKNLMNDTKKEREQITQLFIQPNGTVDFIETVESLGRMAGVKLEIESVGVESLKNKTASSTELFRISLKIEGSWGNAMRLLSLLETMPYKISFDGINLEKISRGLSSDGGKGQEASYWNGVFSFNVLKIKSPSETAAKVN